MSKSKIKVNILSKVLCVLLLLTLYNQVALSSESNHFNREGDFTGVINKHHRGFLKVTAFPLVYLPLELGNPSAILWVRYTVQSQRCIHMLSIGEDTFNLNITLHKRGGTTETLETEPQKIRRRESSEVEEWKLSKEEIEKIERCEVSINIINSYEPWTTRHRKTIFGAGACVALAMTIPLVIFWSKTNKKPLSRHSKDTMPLEHDILASKNKTKVKTQEDKSAKKAFVITRQIEKINHK